MPIPFIAEILNNGIPEIPSFMYSVLRMLPYIIIISLLKLYYRGARNTSERNMHSKVIMITGGTSGIGRSIAHSLASRGAQIILLTQQPPSDLLMAEFVMEMREATSNELIYAEQVDLSSLHSIRLFATKWIDNAPPRRLDMVILCGSAFVPRYTTSNKTTIEGLEPCWGVNYLANFHLLSILSPALRAQPPDRDVRILVATCGSVIYGDLSGMVDTKSPLPKGKEYGTSKLALAVFASAFQKHLDAYERPDKAPNNARVVLVDPGWVRTPGMRLWLSGGTIWGLLAYLLTYPAWWLMLKGQDDGSQSFLRAAMEESIARGPGGKFLKECREQKFWKKELLDDEAVAGKLWAFSEKQIVALEKEGAVKRAQAKKKKEEEHTRTQKKTQEETFKKPKKQETRLDAVPEEVTATDEASTTGVASDSKTKDAKTTGSRRSRKV